MKHIVNVLGAMYAEKNEAFVNKEGFVIRFTHRVSNLLPDIKYADGFINYVHMYIVC